MSELEKIELEFKSLQERHSKASQSISRLEGKQATLKEEKDKLCREIRDAGYDPDNLDKQLEEVQIKLKEQLNLADQHLTSVEQELVSTEEDLNRLED